MTTTHMTNGRGNRSIAGVHAFAARERAAIPEAAAVGLGFLILLAVIL